MRAVLGAILVGGLILCPQSGASADEAPDDAATSAVAWLESKSLQDGLVPTSADWGDVSITLDAVLAAAATDSVGAAETWLGAVGPHLGERISIDVGLLGKALVAADAVGVDGTDVEGINLRQQALDSLGKGGAPGWAGIDEAPEGANAFGQSLIILGLARTGEVPPAAVDFLVAQQCADGGFPMFFGQGDGCGDAVSDPDGTALVVMALRSAAADCVQGADAPLETAVEWLVSQQQGNGSFLGAPPWTAIQNTNSTGVIAGALARFDPAAAQRASEWVAGMQLAAGATEAGAISYDEASRTADPAMATWQNIRSTPQAVLALTRESYATVQLRGTASVDSPPPCAALFYRNVGLPAGQ